MSYSIMIKHCIMLHKVEVHLTECMGVLLCPINGTCHTTCHTICMKIVYTSDGQLLFLGTTAQYSEILDGRINRHRGLHVHSALVY